MFSKSCDVAHTAWTTFLMLQPDVGNKCFKILANSSRCGKVCQIYPEVLVGQDSKYCHIKNTVPPISAM